jgi:hypothetical protein
MDHGEAQDVPPAMGFRKVRLASMVDSVGMLSAHHASCLPDWSARAKGSVGDARNMITGNRKPRPAAQSELFEYLDEDGNVHDIGLRMSTTISGSNRSGFHGQEFQDVGRDSPRRAGTSGAAAVSIFHTREAQYR